MANTVSAWSETCLISLASQNGAWVSYAGVTETVDIDRGDKDIETVANLTGGRHVKKVPEGDTTVTFEAYPVGIGVAGGTNGGFSQFLNRTYDTSEPLTSVNTLYRNKMAVSVLWTNDTTAASGSAGVVSASEGYRFYAKNGYVTSVKPSFTDGILMFTVQIKFPAYNVSGTGNIQEDSCDNTAAMTAIAPYT